MQNFKRNMVSLLVTIVIALAFSANAFSQNNNPGGCVGCVPAGQGWICTSAGMGGQACITDGNSCTLINPCTGGFCAGANVLSNPTTRLEIPDNLIREVGKINPRFATVLISLKKLPTLNFKEGIVNSAPIEITEKDVEMQLAPSENTVAYKRQLKERMAEAFSQKLQATVFHFMIEEISAEYVLKIQITEMGSLVSAHTSLEVNLAVQTTSKNIAEDAPQLLKPTSWKIN